MIKAEFEMHQGCYLPRGKTNMLVSPVTVKSVNSNTQGTKTFASASKVSNYQTDFFRSDTDRTTIAVPIRDCNIPRAGNDMNFYKTVLYRF